MGRRHRPFFRVCAMDSRSPRDGRVIEELGYYDPMVTETDARAVLRGERIDYWLGVGAQPSEKVAVLIKKYGTDGTHASAQAAALERLAAKKPMAPPPMVVPQPKPAEAPAAEAPAAEAPAAEAPAAEAPAAEEAAAEGTDKSGEEAAGEAADSDKS
jgi:small subunit ribosomal protein S16